MTNFDYLKNFNHELYEIGKKLEEDVITSPRAVTADATLFLENLVKDIYRLSEKKLEKNLISFYKKIDHLYRSGIITYIYKNKLQDAYNLRNKIHKENLDPEEEKKLALDLHKRLFYIAKKYFRDYCENERYINIPEYNSPQRIEIHFDNCIICGNSNRNSQSNMCRTCNQKIENANFMLSLQNNFKDSSFTRQDLIDMGISESHAIILLMDLSKYDAIINNGEHYILNPENFDNYLAEIDKYVEIGLLITRFYRDEITASEIKSTDEYRNGEENLKPYRELYKLVNMKILRTFEENLIKYRDIDKSIKLSEIRKRQVRQWYYDEKDEFNDGILNDAFIIYNELLISEFFKLKKKTQMGDFAILKELNISNDIFYFWQNQFMGGEFFKKNRKIKKQTLLKEIKNNKTLDDSLKSAKIKKDDFNRMYDDSKTRNGEFYQSFTKDYTEKRKKLLIKHLRKNNLNKAIRLSKITKKEFLKWYYEAEKDLSDFYIKTTELLMHKYLTYRKNDWDKKEILKEINVSKDMFNSWMEHDELQIFRDFKSNNEKITNSLIKRGLIINAIKEGKGKEEAIFSANITPREFMEIYNNSKREKTEFYLRFNLEYEKNRKKLFMKFIRDEDFYCTIQKCEISQKEFTQWYIKEQDQFMSTNEPSAFYLTTTYELMDKYIKARLDGKNKPDAAKSVGLSNTTINKWLNHPEYDLFYEFKKKNKGLTIDLIVKGFKEGKSTIEVSESYDISLKTIDEFIELGRNGFEKYGELVEIYENNVIPNHLDIFLNSFKNKTYYKSLKQAKLSNNEIDYYYFKGKSGDSKFREFYENFLEMKIEIYVNAIISGKSQKIALKNSHISKEEFSEMEDDLNDYVLNERIYLIGDRLTRNRTTGVKLAKVAGITVEELYDWYFKGKNGDVKYDEFCAVFELGFIFPRVLSIRKAMSMGIPEKWLYKKLKKDVGSRDYRIWIKHDIINQKLDYINDDLTIDEDKIFNILDESNFFTDETRDSNLEAIKDMEKSLNKESIPVIEVSIIDKNEAIGK